MSEVIVSQIFGTIEINVIVILVKIVNTFPKADQKQQCLYLFVCSMVSGCNVNMCTPNRNSLVLTELFNSWVTGVSYYTLLEIEHHC